MYNLLTMRLLKITDICHPGIPTSVYLEFSLDIILLNLGFLTTEKGCASFDMK